MGMPFVVDNFRATARWSDFLFRNDKIEVSTKSGAII
jgi:hypothetical protein